MKVSLIQIYKRLVRNNLKEYIENIKKKELFFCKIDNIFLLYDLLVFDKYELIIFENKFMWII